MKMKKLILCAAVTAALFGAAFSVDAKGPGGPGHEPPHREAPPPPPPHRDPPPPPPPHHDDDDDDTVIPIYVDINL